jgi:dTDP-4-dehydrorhamnose reductase
MLGRAMTSALEAIDWPYWAPRRDEIDLSATDPWHGRFVHYDTIFNCAAWTDVDGAESNEAEAITANGHAIRRLLEGGAAGTFVTFSTDYVFDGNGHSPYQIDQHRAPLNAYGRSKAVAEEYLESQNIEWLNIRTSWLYAPWGKNFVLTMRRIMFERDRLQVVDDQRGRPTSAEHLAKVAIMLASCGAQGHWHATDGGECTWFEFAQEIKRLTGAPATIEPCTSDQFPRPAKRPAYSVLDISQTEAELGPMPHWKDNLADVLRRVPKGVSHG